MRAPDRVLSVIVAVCLSVLTGCASTADRQPVQRQLGTGELTFRLAWTGRADLDLHVRSPLGEKIWFMGRTSESGGELDFDCNATPEAICEDPVENIYWVRGRAPDGEYEYRVQLVSPHADPIPVRFRVVVLEEGEIVETREGELSEPHSTAGPWSFVH